jgi:hypothetical protein
MHWCLTFTIIIYLLFVQKPVEDAYNEGFRLLAQEHGCSFTAERTGLPGDFEVKLVCPTNEE